MTAQASDSILYREQTYSIAGISGAGLFHPTKHGFKVGGMPSFCWRGYICSYAVRDSRLLLSEFRVFYDRRRPEDKPSEFERTVPQFSKTAGVAVYSPLDRVMNFTGGLLLGREFIQELYIHMGFHPAWKFHEVHELIFDSGKLVAESDRSDVAEAFRQRAGNKDRPPDDMGEVENWVKQAFSLRYDGR